MKNSVHISVEIFVIKNQLLRVGILDVIRDINIWICGIIIIDSHYVLEKTLDAFLIE